MSFIKIAHRIYSKFWKITKPKTMGARAILVRDNEILLVKHSYLNSWFLPGGGLKSKETFEQAIHRELLEELGIAVSDLKLFGVYNNFFEGKSDCIVVFSSENFTNPTKKSREVSEFKFFPIESLPEKISPGTKRRIEEFASKKYPCNGLW